MLMVKPSDISYKPYLMNTIFNRILLVIFLLLPFKPVNAQVMLNGSFENNTAPLICSYNLLDVNFNNFMSNVTAFGGFTGGGNEIDLMLAGCNVPTIPNGLFCIALANVPSDAVAIRLSSPLVQGGVYQFYFWAYSDTTLRVQGDVEVGLSNNSQAFGVPIYTAATIPSTWVYYTVNFTAPINGNYITVRNKSGAIHWNRVDAFSFDTCSMNLYLGEDTTLCLGESVTLDASAFGTSFSWQDGSTNPSYNVNMPGVYWVNVTKDGCTWRDSINVNYAQAIPVNLGNDTILCEGDSLFLSATQPNALYQWQNFSDDSVYTVTTTGMYWVDVTRNNCVSRDTIIVWFNPMPYVDIGSDSTLCNGDTIVLNAQSAGDTYHWQDGDTNYIYTATQTGIYWVDITLDNCTMRDSVQLTFNTQPPVLLGNDTSLCAGDAIILNAYSPGFTYHWVTNATDSAILVSQSGIYWVDVTGDRCTTRDSILVVFNPYPVFSLGNDTTLCDGEVFTMNLSIPNSSYQWNNNSTGNIYTVNAAGTYWVDVTTNNCSSRDSIQVSYTALPQINIGNDTLLCENDTLLIDATLNGGSYQWNNNSSNPSIIINQSGIYWVDVTVNNCISRDSIEINYTNNPIVNLGENTSICEEAIIVLDAGITNAAYQWQDGSSNQIYTVTQPGTYFVTVIENNCYGSDTIIVEEEICEPVLIMPNTFTPNGDGQNDNFFPIEMSEIASATMTIYNRWGTQVFDTSDLKTGWNGKNNSGECITGTYFWIIEYVSKTNKLLSQNGTLLLVK